MRPSVSAPSTEAPPRPAPAPTPDLPAAPGPTYLDRLFVQAQRPAGPPEPPAQRRAGWAPAWARYSLD